MTAADLEALADRLMLGEYTTADLHAAARCARGWAAVMRMSGDPTYWWHSMMGRLVSGHGYKYDNPIEAVEAAEVKP